MSKFNEATETQIVSGCISMLNIMGCMAWRNNSGALKDNTGRIVHFGKPGSADILGLTKDGKFLAVECKVPGGKTSALQKTFLTDVQKHGGIAMVVHSVDELIHNFDLMDEGEDYDRSIN